MTVNTNLSSLNLATILSRSLDHSSEAFIGQVTFSWLLVGQTKLQIGPKWHKFTPSLSQTSHLYPERMLSLQFYWGPLSLSLDYINPSRSFHSHNPALLHECDMRWQSVAPAGLLKLHIHNHRHQAVLCKLCSKLHSHSCDGFHVPSYRCTRRLKLKITFIVRGFDLSAAAAEHFPLLFPGFHVYWWVMSLLWKYAKPNQLSNHWTDRI